MKKIITVLVSALVMGCGGNHDHDHDHGEEDVKFTIIPIMANYLIGSGNHKLALSGGVIQVSASADTEDGEYDLDLGMLPSASVGYRYQRAAGGFFFNANVGISLGFTNILIEMLLFPLVLQTILSKSL